MGNGDGKEGKSRNIVKKLLVVAGLDRLDTPLTIAHMQGKFQYKNVPNSGHVIHEENPHVFFDLLMNFCSPRTILSQQGSAGKENTNAWTASTPLETVRVKYSIYKIICFFFYFTYIFLYAPCSEYMKLVSRQPNTSSFVYCNKIIFYLYILYSTCRPSC